MVASYPNVVVKGTGLASGAGLPDTIFSYEPFSSPEIINKIDVQATPTVVATADELGLGNFPYVANASDMAVSSDGSHLLAGLVELNTSNLTGSGIVYPGADVTGISMTSAHGGLFAAGLNGDAIARSSQFCDRVPDGRSKRHTREPLVSFVPCLPRTVLSSGRRFTVRRHRWRWLRWTRTVPG